MASTKRVPSDAIARHDRRVRRADVAAGEERRGIVVKVSLNSTEAAELDEMRGPTARGRYIREYLFSASGQLARSMVRRGTIDEDLLRQTQGMIARWGSNLNQLARTANLTGAAPSAAELERMRRLMIDMQTRIEHALEGGDRE